MDVMERFWSKVRRAGTDDCWPWLAWTGRDGYGEFQLNGQTVRAHRLAYELAFGSPGSNVVRHSCDNPACVNPRHLVLGTQADNVADRVARNRSAIGERHGRAKLREADVLEIRRSTADVGQLAAMFRVDPKAVRSILNGTTWKYLLPEPAPAIAL